MTGLWLALALAAAGQEAPAQASAGPPAIRGTGAFIGVSVADLEASTRWYEERLGLRVIARMPANQGTAATILEGHGLLVELIRDEAAVPLRTAAPAIERNYRVHGIFKAGVIVADYEALLERLRAQGAAIAIGPFPARADQRANFIIRDNEGNYLQFFGDYLAPGQNP